MGWGFRKCFHPPEHPDLSWAAHYQGTVSELGMIHIPVSCMSLLNNRFVLKLRGIFLLGVVFEKGCEFLLVSLGEGFGVGFRWVLGGGFLWKMRENGEGGGG